MTLQVVDAAVRNAKASPTIEEVGGKLILTNYNKNLNFQIQCSENIVG